MAEGQTARQAAPAELGAALQFTVPYAVNLTLTRTASLFSPRNLYQVKDANGNVVFKAKRFFFSSRRLLLDAAGTPILTIKPKTASFHEIWRVFRGKSTSSNDLWFRMRKPKIFQWKKYDVVLATNTDGAAPCDFKITSRRKKCTICIGEETGEIIAQMNRKTAFFARDKLEITVNPNQNFAFVVSLIVIQEEINERLRKARRMGTHAFGDVFHILIS